MFIRGCRYMVTCQWTNTACNLFVACVFYKLVNFGGIWKDSSDKIPPTTFSRIASSSSSSSSSLSSPQFSSTFRSSFPWTFYQKLLEESLKVDSERKETTCSLFGIMIGRLFRAHGEFCASHPWEVIVVLLTVTACMLTVDKQQHIPAAPSSVIDGVGNGGAGAGNTHHQDPTSSSYISSRYRPCHGWTQNCDGLEAEYNAADVIVMTIVRCTAVLYCYYQFCSLHKLGSKYILGKFK